MRNDGEALVGESELLTWEPPAFIELHDHNGDPVLINVAWIMTVDDRGNECRVRMAVTEAGAHYGLAAQESYAEIKAMLTPPQEAETNGD